MRKISPFIAALLLVSSQVSAQHNEHSVSIYTSLWSNNVLYHPPIYGRAAETHEKGFLLLGFEYSRQWTSHLSINTGLEYARHKLNVHYWMDNPFLLQLPDNNGRIELLTIPLSLRLQFLRYMFIQGGILIDKQIANDVYNQLSGKNDVVSDQTGMGALFKIGGKYKFKHNLAIFTSLAAEVHSLIPFTANAARQRMMDGELQAGIEYRF